MFDVKTAFLNAELETPMYLEWPEFIRELGYITEEEESDRCIKLVRSMYRNIDAALRWKKAFTKLCANEEIGCIQGQTGPCILYKRNKNGELELLIAVYVDDIVISGREQKIQRFKTKFKKTYKLQN